MKHVVILGGGFAGISAARELIRKTSSRDVKITLIDRHDAHLFTPSLYEVATSESPQKNIVIPIKEIFGKKVEVIKSNIKSIDTKTQNVVLSEDKQISYDYLILTLEVSLLTIISQGLKKTVLHSNLYVRQY